MSFQRFVLMAFLLIEASQIHGDQNGNYRHPSSLQLKVRNDIKGRLLSPSEGCGYSKAQNKRIVGGGPAQIGKRKLQLNPFHEKNI